MDEARKKALYGRLMAARAKGPHYFAERGLTPERIARLAYNSSLIEGRVLSPERLREAARSLLAADEG